MTLSAKEKALGVLSKLDTILLQAEGCQPSNDKHYVQDLIQNEIEGAYKSCTQNEESNAFFEEFCLLINTEQQSSTHQELFKYLKTLDLDEEPLKIIKKLDLYKNFWKRAYKEPGILVDNIVSNPLFNNLEQYAFPFSLFIYPLAFVGVILIGGAFVFSAMSLGVLYLGITFVQEMIKGALSTVTAGFYDNRIDLYKKPMVKDALPAYLKKLQKKMIDEARKINEENLAITLENMDSDKFWKYLIAEYLKKKNSASEQQTSEFIVEAENYYYQQVKDTIEVASLDKIKLACISLYESFTLPMQQVKINKYVSALIFRPLQVIASPFLLGAVVLGELAEKSVVNLFILGTVLFTTAYYSMLTILNMPLYVYTLVVGLMTSASDKNNIYPDLAKPMFPEEQAKQLDDLGLEPVHHASPLAVPGAAIRNEPEIAGEQVEGEVEDGLSPAASPQ